MIEFIGKEIARTGISCDVSEIKKVTTVDGYDAIIIGAPFYMGHIMKEFPAFINRYHAELVKLPVAAFAVGMAPLSNEPGSVEHAMEVFRRSLQPLSPVTTILFAGRLEVQKLSFISRKIIKLVNSPTGDYRDWDVISSWTREFLDMLNEDKTG